MKVVILGSGYAGVWCYRALRRWLGSRVEITVVSEHPFHSYHGFVGDVLGGSLTSAYLNTPLDECMPKAQHVIGVATAVDVAQNVVDVEIDGKKTSIAYDHLVVATGARENTATVAGLEEHAWRLRTPGNVANLLQHARALQQRLDHQEQIVVIGGGFTGTEVAAALGRLLGARAHVSLVISGHTVVPQWQHRHGLQRQLARALERGGVTLLKHRRVAEVKEHAVVFTDGSEVTADLIIAANGNRACVPVGLEAYTLPNGRMRTENTTRVLDNVWAVGDVAEIPGLDGAPITKDALWATAAGTRAGRNIARVARGAEPRRFGFRGFGTAATFEPGVTVATMFGFPLYGQFAYFLRQITFLWFVPSRRNAWRILRSKWLREHNRQGLVGAEA